MFRGSRSIANAGTAMQGTIIPAKTAAIILFIMIFHLFCPCIFFGYRNSFIQLSPFFCRCRRQRRNNSAGSSFKRAMRSFFRRMFFDRFDNRKGTEYHNCTKDHGAIGNDPRRYILAKQPNGKKPVSNPQINEPSDPHNSAYQHFYQKNTLSFLCSICPSLSDPCTLHEKPPRLCKNNKNEL